MKLILAAVLLAALAGPALAQTQPTAEQKAHWER